MVLEVYFDYAVIDRMTGDLRSQILPIALGGLLLLQLVQFPIAASLAGRVRRHEVDRAALVERNLAESERERRIIAADLHDGPVQDLAGVSYALGALRGAVPAERQPTVDRLTDAVRRAVAALRQAMIDVYPPDLSGEGLPQAVQALTQRLRDQDIEVHLVTGPLPAMQAQQTAALYRTAKESLANVVHHAEASTVWISLETVDGPGPRRVRLVIADDGVGFPSSADGRVPEGHLGLHFMTTRLTDHGGSVELAARPGGGAMVTAELPLDSAE
jgi:signal transduction histidine kinase